MLRTSVAQAAAVAALLVSVLGVAAASAGSASSAPVHADPAATTVATQQTMGWS
ncbi:hypothetical protein [Streptomyces sp. ERV7]|uniref:hypothetical protein n=1 Tax=Streptomyces sp. ERV7 TaxID=1322334 RepID=UPI000B14911C|nr:hypothetical protein [Streptomyces sp. ERV7]